MSPSVVHVVKVAGISGAENHLLLLLPALRARGWDVGVAMLHEHEPGAEEFAARLELDGVPVERVPLRRTLDPRAFRRILRRARRERPAILHTHLVHADFHGLPAGRLARVPVLVSTKHGFNPFRERRAFAAADRGVAALADVHVAISAGLARYLAEREGFDPASFEVVHYGIEAGPEPAPLSGEPRLAIVGRLIPIKGHDVLLRSLAAARDAVPGLTLEVAGDGPLEGELRATAARLGLEDAVSFLGRVAPAAPVFERANVVVVPSFGEGFGMVALEAMERGRPVVASTVGGLPEIVDDGRTGILVPPGDADALAAALVDLVRDPARAAAMGAAGRARALGEFAQERCTDRIEALYETALSAAGARRLRRSAQARSSANAASSASTKSQGAR
ncbi:MAG: glycosyltransferase family 4 protein [Gaiella sp.]|nr:glycosyltransferase family 4 protein [Gaiella sp.]